MTEFMTVEELKKLLIKLKKAQSEVIEGNGMKIGWMYKDMPVYDATSMSWLEKMLFKAIPEWKVVTIDGTLYYKKFKGILYLTKFERTI